MFVSEKLLIVNMYTNFPLTKKWFSKPTLGKKHIALKRFLSSIAGKCFIFYFVWCHLYLRKDVQMCVAVVVVGHSSLSRIFSNRRVHYQIQTSKREVICPLLAKAKICHIDCKCLKQNFVLGKCSSKNPRTFKNNWCIFAWSRNFSLLLVW